MIFNFRFFNFIFILAAFGYVIKKYIIPALNQMIENRKLFWDDLESAVERAEIKKNNITDEFEQQLLYSQQLLQKLDRWKLCIKNKFDQQILHRNTLEYNAQKYVLVQQEKLIKNMLQEQINPLALEKTEQTLKHYFADIQNQQKFIQKALTCESVKKDE